MDRKRSTIFPLEMTSADGHLVSRAYYKAPFFPDADERPRRNLPRTKEALLRSEEFGNRFDRISGESGIQINTTLAMDPETYEVITAGVEGRPMGNPVGYLWTARRRDDAKTACRRVGKAVRLLEGFPVPDPDLERDRIWGETQRKLESAVPTLSLDETKALGRRFAQLLDDAFDQDRPVVVAHGDLSPSNILVSTHTTGIIDFMWMPQLRGFDLARFAHRLRFATLAPRTWTKALIGATLDGYGDRTAPERPGWRFVALQRALATALTSTRGPGIASARRALNQIRSAL